MRSIFIKIYFFGNIFPFIFSPSLCQNGHCLIAIPTFMIHNCEITPRWKSRSFQQCPPHTHTHFHMHMYMYNPPPLLLPTPKHMWMQSLISTGVLGSNSDLSLFWSSAFYLWLPAGMMNHPPIPISQLAEHTELLKANDNLRLSQEYEVTDESGGVGWGWGWGYWE